jgi:uncharacterized protein YfaP (DUF2135 family)
MKQNLLNYFTLLLVVVSLVGLSSCNKEDATPKYELSGNVLNTTDHYISNASVELLKEDGGIAMYSTTTNSNGEYTFDNVEIGTYKLTVNAYGYNLTIIDVEITENTSQNIKILGSATISGTIINSQTGYGLSNAKVSFTVDQSATTGLNADLQVTTDYSGDYYIENAPTGTFTCIIEADGFFVRKIENIVFSVGYNTVPEQTIVEEPEAGAIRIILTWGIDPSDLDSHLTGPSATDRFHVYYSTESFGDDVNLDVDDTDSYGPETITINNFYTGVYRYSVHNYSDQSTLGGSEIAQSSTKVEIYDYNGLVESYTAPAFTGYGNTWRVFEINVTSTDANVYSINSYVQASSTSDTETFKNIEDKEFTSYNIKEW